MTRSKSIKLGWHCGITFSAKYGAADLILLSKLELHYIANYLIYDLFSFQLKFYYI